jgi:hypothetical protein
MQFFSYPWPPCLLSRWRRVVVVDSVVAAAEDAGNAVRAILPPRGHRDLK